MLFKDFKKFIMRGNVLDLAVAVIVGGAFSKIVSSLVNDIIMPVLGIMLGKVNFKTLKLVIKEAGEGTPEVAVYYGQFIQNVVDFIIIAFVIFMMIRLIEKLKSKPVPKAPAAPAQPSADIQLLTEIRDLLKAK